MVEKCIRGEICHDKVRLIEDELGGKIITELTPLRPKTYNYSTNDQVENKKTKGTKKCVIKQKKLNLKIIKMFI